MGQALYVDVSGFQGKIDWPVYAPWARQWDGKARACIKVTEGVGFTDPDYAANRRGAEAAGVDEILYYHFARPDLGNSAQSEANWLSRVLGAIRPTDSIMLDYELTKAQFTPSWAVAWGIAARELYTGNKPKFYSYDAYIRARMQDARLPDVFDLIDAIWQFNPNERPPCPPPWKTYVAVQYSDRAIVPGISGPVDANIDFIDFGGAEPMSISLANPLVAQHFTKVSDTEWHCIQTGYSIKGPLLKFYQGFGGSALCGLTWLGLPVSPEIPHPGSQHGAVLLHLENGVLILDVAHEFDIRPGDNGPVYLAKLYSGAGQDPRIAQLQAQLAALEQKISTSPTVSIQAVDPTLTAQITTLQGQLSGALSRLAQINQLSGVGT